MSFKSGNETGRTLFLKVRESAINSGKATLPFQLGRYTLNPGCEIPEIRAKGYLANYPQILEVTDKLEWNGPCEVIPVYEKQPAQDGVRYIAVQTDKLSIKRRELAELEAEELRRQSDSEVEKLGEGRSGGDDESDPAVTAHIDAAVSGTGGMRTQKGRGKRGSAQAQVDSGHVMG